jgi:2-methylcitrate dehydratase
VDLWRKVVTVEDEEWNCRFDAAAPLDKHHGARAVITFADGRALAEELAVADSHPRGAAPWGKADYSRKFNDLTAQYVSPGEGARFLDAAFRAKDLSATELSTLGLAADLCAVVVAPRGLLDMTPK